MANGNDAGTKERLLDAAREVFCRKGARDATVRDICSLARANVAAVNYHFGGKERLYMAVLMDFLAKAQEKYPVYMGSGPDAPAEDRLKSYIRSLLYRLMGDGDPQNERLGQLLTAEFIEPSEHFAEVSERYLMPQHNVLIGILREMLPGVQEEEVHLSAAGVVGHCLLFDNAKELIRLHCPDMSLERLGVERVADFVHRFALAGISRTAQAARP